MKVFGFAGYSGSGKTTLLEQVIPQLVAQGLRVSVIKHAHHEFDVDRPGKDSWRHRQAGCSEVLITSARRWAIMHELRGDAEPTLDAHLARMTPCDLVLVEGFKHAPVPKIEVRRRDTPGPLLFPDDPHIIAIATDDPSIQGLDILDINAPGRVARYIADHLALAWPQEAGGAASR